VPEQNGTVLSNEEMLFQSWIRSTPWFSEYVKEYGEEPNLNTPDYDYRSAWKSGEVPVRNKHDIKLNSQTGYIPPKEGRYHWGRFKSKEHPTYWKELYMQKHGVDPDDIGITKEQYFGTVGK